MILLANYKDKRWHGVLVPRGSFISSRDHMSKRLGLSVQTFRTLIDRLKSTGEVTSQSTSTYTMYTIVNYGKYQIPDFQVTSQSTSKVTNDQPTSNQRVTTTKEYIGDEFKEKEVTTNVVTRPKRSDGRLYALFDRFWKEYPDKTGIEAAKSVWRKLNPDQTLAEKILSAIAEHKKSTKWKTGFIVSPAKFLSEGRWQDEVKLSWENQDDQRTDGTSNREPF